MGNVAVTLGSCPSCGAAGGRSLHVSSLKGGRADTCLMIIVSVSVPVQPLPADTLRAHPFACRLSCQWRSGSPDDQALKMAHDLNWL